MVNNGVLFKLAQFFSSYSQLLKNALKPEVYSEYHVSAHLNDRATFGPTILHTCLLPNGQKEKQKTFL